MGTLIMHEMLWQYMNSQYSRGFDVSNFIGSDQKVVPYHPVMTPKSDFLLTGAGTITPKVSMNRKF